VAANVLVIILLAPWQIQNLNTMLTVECGERSFRV
jgi:hypothetical protein